MENGTLKCVPGSNNTQIIVILYYWWFCQIMCSRLFIYLFGRGSVYNAYLLAMEFNGIANITFYWILFWWHSLGYVIVGIFFDSFLRHVSFRMDISLVHCEVSIVIFRQEKKYETYCMYIFRVKMKLVNFYCVLNLSLNVQLYHFI